MSTGALILLGALALALVVGAGRALGDGRFRGTRRLRSTPPAPPSEAVPPPAAEVVALVGAVLGERATLLQFSTAFCAPCRATRRVLAGVAELVPGVVHVEVDAEQHLDAVRRLAVLRTPTTLVLGPDGVEATRATGAPRTEQVLTALAALPD